MAQEKPIVTVLDYGAGNVRSLVNAVKFVGWDIKFVKSSDDIDNADILIFPGVGAFGSAMAYLEKKNYLEPLKQYVRISARFASPQLRSPYVSYCAEFAQSASRHVQVHRCRQAILRDLHWYAVSI